MPLENRSPLRQVTYLTAVLIILLAAIALLAWWRL